VQLDNTRVVIRERSLPELLDLSLQVTRVFIGPLLLSMAALVLPLMLLNWWLIGWMAWEEYDPGSIARYLATMTQLVFIEAPLASAVTTLFLGQVMFRQPVCLADTARDLASLAHRLLWGQGVLRGVFLAWFLAACISPDEVFSPVELFLPILCVLVGFARCLRPYLTEIILLERNPYRARDAGGMTVRVRSRKLHSPNSGDLVGRALGIAPIAVLLVASLIGSWWFLIGTFSNDWTWGPVMVHLVAPVAMWLVAMYFTVVRFLSYLDLRIRREGWEVELKMRAEAARLARQVA
jgi:hypothetical protein